MTAPDRPLWPVPVFLTGTALVYGLSVGLVVPNLDRVPHPDLLAAALAIDLVLLVPVAYGLLVVRTRRARPWSVVPIVLLSLILTAWMLPGVTLQSLAVLALPLLEVVLIGVIVGIAVWNRRGAASDDALARLQQATASAVGDHAASRALAYELAVVRYALGPSRRPERAPFGVRRGYGAVVVGLLTAAAFELVGGHLLVSHLWGPSAAIVHAALSAYAVLWVLGDWRALGSRTTCVDGVTLRLRIGIRWSVDVPIDTIRTLYAVRGPLPTDEPILDLSVSGPAQYILVLDRPADARGPYGIRRTVSRIALRVDEPERFLTELAAAMREARA